jgi:putative DNA primase/helicase
MPELQSTDSRPNPREIICCQNGLLHVPTRQLLPHTPEFFTFSVTEFAYDPAAQCPTWLRVLHDYWPEEGGEALLLQEMFGYSLMPITYLQKIFVLLGPGRSGKGTISKVLTMLVGEKNVASPNLGALAKDFGTQPMINKTLCIVGEAGFGRNDDRSAVTNFLKTVSGEDRVEINRKNKAHFVGRLLIRFWLLCNKIPEFDDAGKALAARMVPLKMTLSFVNREDEHLAEKLQAEIAGIMNWALEGYDRLMRNGGKFTMPQSSIETKEDVGRMASPAQSYFEDCCEFADKKEYVSEDDLYAHYEQWCEKCGQRPLSKSRLVENIVSAEPARIKKRMLSEGPNGDKQVRTRVLGGIKLRGPAPRPRAAAAADNDVKEGEIPF